MAKYQLWMEGFMMNGGGGTASYEGEYEANSFEEACDKWANEKPYRLQLYTPSKNGSRPCYWGCNFYDNEADARKTYG